jgi:hypothetical protein
MNIWLAVVMAMFVVLVLSGIGFWAIFKAKQECKDK